MQELFVTTCACKHTDHPFTRQLHIATLTLPGTDKQITVSAIILDAIPELGCGPDNRIIQTFPLLFTPDDLLPALKVQELWYKGKEGIRYAIEQQWKKDWRKHGNEPLPFRLGPHFIESVNEAGLDTNEIMLTRIIRAAAAVIADQAKNSKGFKLHEKRESEAANSPQHVRKRDKAKAWRLMLEQHGAGWRLHYWQIPTQAGSAIEFSNVVKESDATIYE